MKRRGFFAFLAAIPLVALLAPKTVKTAAKRRVQVFNSSGSWGKPPGGSVLVSRWGRGGGHIFKAADFGATESVTIGMGGGGGHA